VLNVIKYNFLGGIMKKLIYGFLVLLSFFLFNCSSISPINQPADKGLVRPTDLENELDKLIKNFDQYEIVLTSLDKGQEHLKILDAYRGKTDIVIKFQYKGETRLTLTKFDKTNAKVYGTYPIILPFPISTSTVKVKLIFNSDGNAYGKWQNLGFENQFDIIRL
jgi:hypothetical protein